jgi:hypothetical protein
MVGLDYWFVSAHLELDGNTVNGPQARLVQAELTARWDQPDHRLPPYISATLGLFKTPFGFEIQESDRDRLFMERSNMERAMFPGEYDLGVKLQGGWRFARYQVGAMNGHPIGEKDFPGRDPSHTKDLVARLGVDTPILSRVAIRGGVSVDYGTGFHRGTPATKDTLVWRDIDEDGIVQNNELTVIPGMTATPSLPFDRYAFGGDLALIVSAPRLGDLIVYGELVWASNMDRALEVSDPVAVGRDQRQLGWYVAATQELGRYAIIGLRYDTYNPDRDSNVRSAGTPVPLDSSFSTLSATAAVRLPGYARLSTEYQHNTNPLGRTLSGMPTSLADDLFMVRGQAQF